MHFYRQRKRVVTYSTLSSSPFVSTTYCKNTPRAQPQSIPLQPRLTLKLFSERFCPPELAPILPILLWLGHGLLYSLLYTACFTAPMLLGRGQLKNIPTQDQAGFFSACSSNLLLQWMNTLKGKKHTCLHQYNRFRPIKIAEKEDCFRSLCRQLNFWSPCVKISSKKIRELKERSYWFVCIVGFEHLNSLTSGQIIACTKPLHKSSFSSPWSIPL